METRTILYVDDDPDDRELLTGLLQEAGPGVRVALAANGVEALRYLENACAAPDSLPALIILDLNMPYLDGNETLERIRHDQRFAGITVIIFSSSERPDDARYFQSRGIEFISKPDNLPNLSDIASQLLKRFA